MLNRTVLIGVPVSVILAAALSALHGIALLGYILRFVAGIGFALSVGRASTADHPHEQQRSTTDAALCFLAFCVANYGP
jgi:hypothetical protein